MTKTLYAATPEGRIQQTYGARVLHEVAAVSNLTFAYDDATGMLLWHGPTEIVTREADAYHQTYPETRLALVVFPDGTPLDGLNRALSHSGGIVPEVRRRLQRAKVEGGPAPQIHYLEPKS